MNFRTLFFLFCISLFSACQAEAPNVYALKDIKIVPVNGEIIAKGTIILRDGIIEAVGVDIPVPADAFVIDCAGLTAYPGFINSSSHLGMAAVTQPAMPNTPEEWNRFIQQQGSRKPETPKGYSNSNPSVHSDIRAIDQFTIDTSAEQALQKLGFTTTLVIPNGGLFVGQSALVSVREGTVGAIAIKRAVAQHFRMTDIFGQGYPESLMGTIALGRQTLMDAQWSLQANSAYLKNGDKLERPVIDRSLEALFPVVEHNMPFVVEASSGERILRALKLDNEFDLAPIIDGGQEAYKDVAQLKHANAKLFLSLDFPDAPKSTDIDPAGLSDLRRYALAPDNPKVLYDAGIPFSLTTSGLKNIGDFSARLKLAIERGLPHDAALEALTIVPARFLGIDDKLGSIEKGKIADLVITQGDMFADKSQVKMVFVDGRKIEMDTKPTAPAAPGGRSGGGGRRRPRAAGNFTRPDAPPSDDSSKKSTPPPKTVVGPLFAPAETSVKDVLFKNATVWTVTAKGTQKNTDVLIRNGKIAAIGKNLSSSQQLEGVTVVDATGMHLTPGIVDCHSHTAIDGDVNEGTNICTAEVRIADVINNEDIDIYRELAGGTTTANTLHGSANAIGGQNCIIKFRWGKPYNEMIFSQAPQGIKFALGENPKRSTGRYPNTRLGIEEIIRDRLLAARDYRQAQADYRNGLRLMPPKPDLQLDALAEILEGTRLVHSHCYRQDEILMLMRLAEEFGFRIKTFQHVLEGYKVADEMAKHGVGGSTFSDWWAFKIEAYDAIPYNGALMQQRGVVVSFNSDSAELARRLNLEAAKAVKYGDLSPEEAIKFVTINPAIQLGIDKYVGSLEVGKDADLALWSGDPLSVYSICEMTFVDGVREFDRKSDIAARKGLEIERTALIDWVKNSNKKPDAKTDKPGDKPADKTAEKPADKPADKPDEKPYVPVKFRQVSLPKTPQHLGSGTYILSGGTVHTMAGEVIPNGSVLFKDGLIREVGAHVTRPSGAKVFDCKGMQVYPGLINAGSNMGLTEIGAVDMTNDSTEGGDFNPNLKAEIAVNPDSEHIPVARANGITTCVVSPDGGMLSGLAAAIHMDGWTWEDLTMQSSLGLDINFPNSPVDFGFMNSFDQEMRAGEPATPKSDDEPETAEMKKLNAYLEEARRYRLAREAAPIPGHTAYPKDVRMEALLSVLDGKVPVFVNVNGVKAIKLAVAWSEKQNIKMILVSGRDSWRIADFLAKHKVPVILGAVLDQPRREDDPYDSAYTAPKKLFDAGVQFCFANYDASNVRNLPYHAAMAACFGLPREEAMKDITINSAKILGLDDRIGSLEAGKEADIIVTTGDPLEITSKVKYEFIGGKPVDLNNKHLRLYEKYKKRPLPTQPSRGKAY